MPFRSPKAPLFISVALGVFFFDQITKRIIEEQLFLHEAVPVIPGFFQIVRVHNRGAAFGILRDLPETVTTPLFLSIGTLALAVLLLLVRRVPPQEKLVLVALAGITGGAVGNLWDRIRLGYVIDFLDVYVKQYHWPAFNLADSSISLGVTYLLLRSLFGRDPFAPREPHPEEAR